MLLSVAFYLNSFGSFLLQIVLGACLAPGEYARYATVSLAALILAGLALDWLKVSALRFSSPSAGEDGVGAALEAGYIAVVATLYLGVAVAWACHWTFGLTPALVAMTPLLAVSFNRVDFAGARFRALELDRRFGALFALRLLLYFTLVVGVAWATRDATAVVTAMAVSSFAAAVLAGRGVRAAKPDFGRAARQRLGRFFVYGQPVVVSVMLYQLGFLINRTYALHALGPSTAGSLSLATDVGSRLFLAVNALPEFLLFQIILRRLREKGAAAAMAQAEVNGSLAFALIVGLATGYMTMANTFAALVAPVAYRGDFAGVSVALAPGLAALCLIVSAINPVFQIAGRTLPLALAGGVSVAVNLALLRLTNLGLSAEGLARINSIGFGVGLVVTLAFAASARARPRWRDLAIVSLAALALGLSLKRLDALPSHGLAAALALGLGGGLYAATLVAFNVGNIRSVVAPLTARLGFRRAATNPRIAASQ